MSSALSKKQLISLLILLGLIFILPLSLLLTKQRQEMRKKAASPSGPLQLTLIANPATNPNRGDTITYTVKITNTSAASVQIRVAGVEFTVRQNNIDKIGDFTILDSSFNCGSSLELDAKAFGDTLTGKIRLVCYKTPGGSNSPLEIAANSMITLGSFQITVKQSATGSYKISSKEADGGRNNIPQAADPYTDLSDVGASATLTISGTATNTPTPTGVTGTPPPPAWNKTNCNSTKNPAVCSDWGNAGYGGDPWSPADACGCCEQCCKTLVNPATGQPYCAGSITPEAWCRTADPTNRNGWEHSNYCPVLPTSTPTTPPGTCPNGEFGNLNCDTTVRQDGQQGLINSLDLTILLGRWSPEGPAPTPIPGQHSADIVVDNKVNSLDLTKLLGHWKVE